MCEPLTIAAIGVGLAGAGVSAYGQKQAGNANEAIAQRNSAIAGYAAQDAVQRGDVNANIARMKGAAFEGQQRAAITANGIDSSSGTAAQTLAGTKLMTELDAATIKNNAAREAFGYKSQAEGFNIQGQQAQAAGTYGMYGSILGGVAGAASSAATAYGRGYYPGGGY